MPSLVPIQLAEISETRISHDTAASPTSRVALELNPLSAVSLYRASATVEISFARRFALNLTPSYELALRGGAFGELGLRGYTGVLSGFFVGVSALAGSVSHQCEDSNLTRNAAIYGAAADVGYQWVTRRHVVLGLGIGAQLQRSHTDCAVDGTEIEQALVVPSVATSGVLPRFQFAIGYAWGE
jgi:hypothetical protein